MQRNAYLGTLGILLRNISKYKEIWSNLGLLNIY